MRAVAARVTLQRVRSKLSLARKLAVAAALVQLLLFLPKGVLPDQRLFAVVLVASAVLGIAAFRVAYVALELADEMADARAALGRLGWRASASVQLGFFATFFVPLLNLVVLAWIVLRVRGGLRAVEGSEREVAVLDARRRRVMGG